jgi:hypothetical protein
MDEEVRHTRVLRVLLVKFLQNGSRFKLVGIGCVSRRGGRLKRERIKHLGLVIIRVALRHLLHRAVIGEQSGVEGNLVVVPIIGTQCFDPIALALCLRANRARLL